MLEPNRRLQPQLQGPTLPPRQPHLAAMPIPRRNNRPKPSGPPGSLPLAGDAAHDEPGMVANQASGVPVAELVRTQLLLVEARNSHESRYGLAQSISVGAIRLRIIINLQLAAPKPLPETAAAWQSRFARRCCVVASSFSGRRDGAILRPCRLRPAVLATSSLMQSQLPRPADFTVKIASFCRCFPWYPPPRIAECYINCGE